MKNRFLILLLIVFISAVSLFVMFFRTPKKSAFSSFGKVESTPYNISFYNNYEEIIFTISPLNDYYYEGSLKGHLVNKLEKERKRNFWQEFLVTLKNLFLNKKELFWEASEADLNASYFVSSNLNEVEIERKITSSKSFDAIGQSITICSRCLIVDDKKRAYLQDNDLNKEKIDILESLGNTPVIVREEQFLPSDIERIFILNEKGKTVLEIPVLKNEQISFQNKWGILEFKRTVSQGTEVDLKQLIYISSL